MRVDQIRLNPDCPLCHGQGQRTVACHSFNPALGRPLAIVTCSCVDVQIEEAKRKWRASNGATS